jgi:tetratricopeptide (TPR) repeat protein
MMLPLQSYKINAFFLSKHVGVKETASETVAVAGLLGDSWLAALGNSWLASAEFALGNIDEARLRAELALAAFKELDENWGITWPSQVLAGVARAQGDAIRARAGYQVLLDSAERIGFRRGTQYTYNHLGSTFVMEGDHAGACANFLKSLQISADIGQVREMLGAIYEIAAVQFAVGDLPSALEMLAMIIAHPAGEQVYLFDRLTIREKADALRSSIEDRLDPDTYDAAWSAGRARPLEDFTNELLP